MEKETIVKVRTDYEVKLPMEMWEEIGVKLRDTIDFCIETREASNESDGYDYLRIKNNQLQQMIGVET